MSISSRFGFCAALAAVAIVASASPAHAEDKKAVKRIEEANAKAMEEYDLLEFESAKKILNGALVDIKKAGLGGHPVAAKTHGNLGIVYEGLGDADNALLEFIAALEIDPKWQLPKEYKKPELAKIYETARSTVGKGGGGGGGDDGGDAGGGGDDVAATDVKGLQHAPVEEGKEGASIPVTVKVGADVGAKQVVLYYRAQGQESFTAVPMKSRGGATWEGAIPASATRADSIQYYIEAKGGGGKVNGGVGSAGSPNIIEIARSSSGGGGGGDDVDSEDPLGGGGGGGSDDDDDGGGGEVGDGSGISKDGTPKAKHTVFVNVVVGSGAGFVTGKTEQAEQDVTCCVASAPFHVMPELGFWLSPQLAVSVYGRIGLPIGADIEGHAPAAPAGLLRVAYVLSSDGEGLALHGDVGGGLMRHTIGLAKPYIVDGKEQGKTDIVASGPLLIGGGAHWSKTLGGPLRFVLDFNLLAAIPVVKELGENKNLNFTLNLDFNAGLQFAF